VTADRFLGAALYVLGCAITLVVFLTCRCLYVDAHCKSLGWSRGEIAWSGVGYCFARVNQTDVLVPWQKAGAR
jgi:hypothetical protein